MPTRQRKRANFDLLDGPPSYQTCVKAIRAFAESGDSVLIVGGLRGLGKTTCLGAACWEAIKRGKSAKYVVAVELDAKLKEEYGREGGTAMNWLEQWSGPHLLVVDECVERLPTDHSKIMLTSLVDRRYGMEKPTILAGNFDRSKLTATLGDSILDRANEGGGTVWFEGWASWRGQ